MSGFSVDAFIERSPDEVWATLTDFERAPRWMTGLDWMRVDGPLVAGATVTFSTRGQQGSSEIVEVEKGRRLLVATERKGVRAEYTYSLESENDGTRARLDAKIEGSGWFSRRVCSVVRPLVRRADGGQMDALKALVEEG